MRIGPFGKAQPKRDEQPASAADNEPRGKRKRRGPDLFTLVFGTVMVLGVCIIAYPTFSNWWNSLHQSRAIASYAEAVKDTDPEKIEALLDQARAYNERLYGKAGRYTPSEEENKEYLETLDITGTGIMGYIQYEKLGINYPIYHGVDESVLQIAIGHIQGSSLPVGGATTHAAISGHRGLPSAKLFSDLDKAVEGDTFTITVLNQTLTYQIDQIRIVEPGDMSELDLMRDQDLVTMITCTPYGINTHRMLVRAHRVENAASLVSIPAEAVLIPSYVAVPLAGMPMLFVYLVGALLYSRVADHEVNHETTKSELQKLKEARKARRKANK